MPGPKPPQVVADVVNGKPVLRFDGTESPLVDDRHDWSAKGFTAFVVASYDQIVEKPDINDNPYYRINTPGQTILSDGGSAGLALGLNWNGRPGMAAGISLDPEKAFDPPHPNEQAGDLVIAARTFHAFAYASREGKTNSEANAWDCRLDVSVFVDGIASGVETTPFVSMQAMNGGKRLQIGAAGTRDPFKGDVAEIILFKTEISASDRDRVFAYLRTRYGMGQDVKRLPAEPVVITPTLVGGTFWFRDAAVVEMSTATVDGEIHYTTDGSAPDRASPRYAAPIPVRDSCAIKARAFAAGRDAGPVATASFVKFSAGRPTANKLQGGWKYSWGDEFQDPEVDEAIWGYEMGHMRNSEAQFYTDRRENSRIEDGKLLIQARHDNWNGHAYTSASRSTENKVRLTYGKYEMRAKIDVRSGSWPAWWLWSRPDAGGWPKEGEIDIMEYYTGKCLFNVVDGNGTFDSQRRRLATLGDDRWAAEYHVWTMEWDSEKIDLYLDGVRISHYPVDKANGTGLGGANPYRHPATKKMVLNQALGGSMGGALNPADAPFELRVDWMRVHTWSDEPAYAMTVNGGTGSGRYVPGTRASITAHMPPAGYEFDQWVVNANATVDDPRQPSAILTMPSGDVSVTAIYRTK